MSQEFDQDAFEACRERHPQNERSYEGRYGVQPPHPAGANPTKEKKRGAVYMTISQPRWSPARLKSSRSFSGTRARQSTAADVGLQRPPIHAMPGERFRHRGCCVARGHGG